MDDELRTVDLLRCAGCGWVCTDPPPGVIPGLVKKHLEDDCPGRFFGHPMFGYEPQWNLALTAAGRSELEITWTTASWGSPLRLDAT